MTVADALRADFADEILPLFRLTHPADALPRALEVWEGDAVDGGAWGTTVFVFEGVAGLPRPLRLFAMAHETAHVVTLAHAARLGLGAQIPGPGDYQKAEHLADLIALHTFAEHHPSLAASVASCLDALAEALGDADAMHPSGAERVALLREYLGARDAFDALFARVWGVSSPSA